MHCNLLQKLDGVSNCLLTVRAQTECENVWKQNEGDAHTTASDQQRINIFQSRIPARPCPRHVSSMELLITSIFGVAQIDNVPAGRCKPLPCEIGCVGTFIQERSEYGSVTPIIGLCLW